MVRIFSVTPKYGEVFWNIINFGEDFLVTPPFLSHPAKYGEDFIVRIFFSPRNMARILVNFILMGFFYFYINGLVLRRVANEWQNRTQSLGYSYLQMTSFLIQ